MLSGEILQEDMITTFNTGIGYCLIVPEEVEFDTRELIQKCGLKSWVIGKLIINNWVTIYR